MRALTRNMVYSTALCFRENWNSSAFFGSSLETKLSKFGGSENLFLMGTDVVLERSIWSRGKVKISMSREETLIVTVLALFLLSGLVSEFEFCLKTFSSLPEFAVSPHLDVLMISRGWIDTFRLLFLSVLPVLLAPS